MVHVIKFYVHEIIKYSNKINEMLLFLRVSRVFFFLYIGGALGGARNRNPDVNSFSPIGVLAVCVFGIGTIWGP